jgi:hypothetical protein
MLLPYTGYPRVGQVGVNNQLLSPQPLNMLNHPHAQPNIDSYLLSPQFNPHAQPGIGRNVLLHGRPITARDWRTPDSSLSSGGLSVDVSTGRNSLPLIPAPATAAAPTTAGQVSSGEGSNEGMVSPSANIDHLIRSFQPVTPPSPLIGSFTKGAPQPPSSLPSPRSDFEMHKLLTCCAPPSMLSIVFAHAHGRRPA